MSSLIINSHLIDTPIIDILNKVRDEITNGKLAVIEQKDDYVRVTCPFHKDGLEAHPSCSVYCGDELQYGWFNCLTCGEKGPLYKFVAECFGSSMDYAKDWLVSNFSNTYVVDRNLQLDDIDLSKKKVEPTYLDESILASFQDYHPYMSKRGLSDEIIKKYQIKYDPAADAIVFPSRDLAGHLVGLTRRSVKGKYFYIDKDFSKDNIYLLYNICKDNIKEVFVVESQINALTLETWGYRAVALYGAGTTETQMKILNKSGINHFILAYDNDAAGRKGAEKFKSLVRKDVFVDDILLPQGKDVNDLTKEEFEELLKNQFTL